MSNTLTAIGVINGLLSLSINALLATQQYQALIEAARREGREISDQELAALRAELSMRAASDELRHLVGDEPEPYRALLRQLSDRLRHTRGDELTSSRAEQFENPPTLTGPHCEHRSLEDLPTESCQIFAVGSTCRPISSMNALVCSMSARWVITRGVSGQPRWMFSATVMGSTSRKCWWTMPIPASMAWAGVRKSCATPATRT